MTVNTLSLVTMEPVAFMKVISVMAIMTVAITVMNTNVVVCDVRWEET